MIVVKAGTPKQSHGWVFEQDIVCPGCDGVYRLEERKDRKVSHIEGLVGSNQFLPVNNGSEVVTVCPTFGCGREVRTKRPEDVVIS